jgi:hypothetical protein
MEVSATLSTTRLVARFQKLFELATRQHCHAVRAPRCVAPPPPRVRGLSRPPHPCTGASCHCHPSRPKCCFTPPRPSCSLWRSVMPPSSSPHRSATLAFSSPRRSMTSSPRTDLPSSTYAAEHDAASQCQPPVFLPVPECHTAQGRVCATRGEHMADLTSVGDLRPIKVS